MTSMDLSTKTAVKVALYPRRISGLTTVYGDMICTRGYPSVIIRIMCGSLAGGTFAFKLQHGLRPDASALADVPATDLRGAFASWTSRDSGRIQQVGYVGVKPYLRLVCVPEGSRISGAIAADVFLGYQPSPGFGRPQSGQRRPQGGRIVQLILPRSASCDPLSPGVRELSSEPELTCEEVPWA